MPASTLDNALRSLARQTHLQLARFADLATPVDRVGPVVGNYTPGQALTLLLAGTGLSFRFVGEDSVAIVPTAAGRDSLASLQNPVLSLGDRDTATETAHARRTSDAASAPNSNESKDEGGSMLKHGTRGRFAAFLSVLASTVAAAQNAGGEVGGLEEIIVTATKRSENLKDVPITISVLTAKDIEAAGVVRTRDFLGSIPNVTLQEDDTGENFINIRGQTSSRNSDPNVAIVMDGAVLTSMRDFNQDLFDVEQIEVLKGPQSALYGRNAAAGAIVVTTKAPTDTWTGSLSIERGDYNTSRMTGSISGPITPTVKFRASTALRDTDGTFTDVTSGEEVARRTSAQGRFRLLITPSDKLSVDLKLALESTKGGSLSAAQAQFVGLPIGGWPALKLDANDTTMQFVTNVNGLFEDKYYDATAKVDYAFDFGTLTSVTSGMFLNTFWGGDTPPYIPDTGSPGAVTSAYSYIDTAFSQEFRLTSRNDLRVRWQAGAYYLHYIRDQYNKFSEDTLGVVPPDHISIDGPTAPEPTMSYGHQHYLTDSWAPFASIRYDIVPTLHLTLAGRYDHERRTVAEQVTDAINPMTGASYNLCVQLTGRTADQCHDGQTFTQFEPKVSLAWDATDRINVFANYGKGFKAGGFNPIGGREAIIAAAVANGQSPDSVYVKDGYDKEVCESYEIGTKMRLLNNHVAFNAAVFETDIKGAQQYQFVPTVGLQTTISIDKVKSQGFDLDFNALLPGGVTVFGGYGSTLAKVKSFLANPGFVGNVAPGSFRYTVDLGLSGTFAVGSDLKLTPRIEWNRAGPIWWDVANTAGTERDPVNLVKARLSLGASPTPASARGSTRSRPCATTCRRRSGRISATAAATRTTTSRWISG